MNRTTQIHVEYIGEYVFKSIIMELTVLNRREREESSTVERLGPLPSYPWALI
jgi:hypothetical protein